MPHRKRATELTSPALLFDGGFNYLDQSQVKPNQLVAGRNWWRDFDGVVRPRPGNKVWNAVSLNADFQGLWEYRRAADQVNRLMAYAGGTLFKGDDTTQTFALLVGNLDSSEPGYGANAQDSFWFCNRKQNPRVFDGTNTFRIGIIPAAAAPAVALVALAGNLPAEDHYYRYTYVREEGGIKVRESNPSPESVKVTNTAGSAQNDVTVAASTDAQVTHIYIYRRSSTTVTEYKFVGKTTNVAGTFRDNVAVGSLGAFGFWEPSGGEEDHGYQPDDLFALLQEPHRDGRFYAWGSKSRIHYTRVNQFHYWPGSGSVGTRNGFVIIVNEDDGDEGMALLSEGDDLLAVKRNNVYRLLGDGPTVDDGLFGSWKSEHLATKFGCVARPSAANGPAGAFWLSAQGPIQVDVRTGLPRLIGLELKPWLDTSTDLTKARGWVHDWYYLLFIPVSGGKWEGHVYDSRNRSWWRFEDMDAQAFVTRESGTLAWGGILERDKPSNGVVYEFNKQVTDNGTAVTAELTTRVIDARVGWWKLLWKVLLACEGNPGAEFTGRLIPDQTTSYVERQLKLTATTGTRMLKPFTGTKKLQGYAFQLYLKSVNSTKRPAIYYWQQLIHTLNREVRYPPAFSDAFTDPDPTVAISEGDFSAGSHTNTQTTQGKVRLADDFTWVLAYDGAYTQASSPVVMGGKLAVAARDAANNRMILHVFDGAAWSDVIATASGRYNPTLIPYGLVQRLIVAGGALFLAGYSAVADIKTRKSVDLLNIVDYGAIAMTAPRLLMHGGTLWVIETATFAYYDAGSGTWTSIAPPGAFCRGGGASFKGSLHVTDGAVLRRWTGSAWVVAINLPAGLEPAAHRVLSTNDKLYIAEAMGDGSSRIYEYDGTSIVERLNPGAGVIVNDLVEVIEPDGRKPIYACVGATVQRTYEGTIWENMGTPQGAQVYGAGVFGGRRYAAISNGDIYSSFFFKTSGTYRLDERDFGATKTTALVTVSATVPGGTTLQSRIGYSATPGGPYTFTVWESDLTYQVAINGRYAVVEFQMTGPGSATPEVDSVEVVAR